jgi:hypothetical protein
MLGVAAALCRQGAHNHEKRIRAWPFARNQIPCARRLVATAAEEGGLGRMAKAKRIGWAIYVVGFVIWLFGYLSTGHAAAFDWDVAARSWISSFVPNLEAEFGLALMFASMIPIYWRAGRKRP